MSWVDSLMAFVVFCRALFTDWHERYSYYQELLGTPRGPRRRRRSRSKSRSRGRRRSGPRRSSAEKNHPV